MLRVAICDDMPGFLKTANDLIARWCPAEAEVSTELFRDGDSLIQAHAKKPFDIILLDVVMPLFNGIETAAEIRNMDKNVKIVFLTSSAEFAVDSYSVHANGYLLKPITADKLYQCLNELCAEIENNSRYVLIRDSVSVHRVALHQIEYVEAQGKHVNFMLSDATSLSSLHPFYYYETLLLAQDGFLKCHRSYLVNVFHISKFTAKEITMNSGAIIPISRNCHKDFETMFFDLAFGRVGDV